MSGDVRAIRITATGATGINRGRIRGVTVVTSGAGRLTITDGAGGPTLLDIDTAGAETYDLSIPGAGILASDSVVVATATALSAATIFWT